MSPVQGNFDPPPRPRARRLNQGESQHCFTSKQHAITGHEGDHSPQKFVPVTSRKYAEYRQVNYMKIACTQCRGISTPPPPRRPRVRRLNTQAEIRPRPCPVREVCPLGIFTDYSGYTISSLKIWYCPDVKKGFVYISVSNYLYFHDSRI